jgi:hypothetical protein
MCHMCGFRGLRGYLGGRGEGHKGLVGKRAVDVQHGTTAEGNSHPCTKEYHPKVREFLFVLITTHMLILGAHFSSASIVWFVRKHALYL